MKKSQLAIVVTVGVALFAVALAFYRIEHTGLLSRRQAGGADVYSGTQSCRECHENFYQLWSTSYHGLAMQPFTAQLFQTELAPQETDLVIGEFKYRVELDGENGWMQESSTGGNSRRYPIIHAMGGKYVYYFLTPLDRGRLQVLPLAYDMREKSWFDMAASGIRHFQDIEEEPIGWKEQEYTFNTSC